MTRIWITLMVCWVFFGIVTAQGVRAEDGGDSATQAAPAAKPTQKAAQKTKGGKRTREKDADGTEAPNRFQADTVLKSQYKLNGQPLEVDPD